METELIGNEKKDRASVVQDFYLPAGVSSIIETLEKAGFEAWVVGGSVRDALLGKQPKDYDVATSALPEQVQALFAHTHPTGIAHGTVTVVEDGVPVEVTTFRTDGKYMDHRHPSEVKFVPSLKEDLARRDFTVNAMAWSPTRGFADPFHGREDLEKKVIRAVGDPEKRFEEDALRMLRAYRFAARLGFKLDKKTEEAIQKKQDLTRVLPAERVVPEVEGVMQADPALLEHMTGLLRPWIPELEVMARTEQDSPYHYTDVWHHTLDAMKAAKSRDREVMWALLLHDAGKPEVKAHYDGKDHFKRHEEASARIAARVMDDLKMPTQMKKDVPTLVRYHDTFYAPKPINLYKTRVEKGWDDKMLERLFEVQYGDIMAHKTHDRLSSLEAFARYYHENKNKVPLAFAQLPVNGEDIRQAGYEGAEIRKAQLALLKALIAHPQWQTKEKCLELLKEKNFVR